MSDSKQTNNTLNSNWREHPKLRSLFHSEYPDNLMVLVHDGGPKFSSNDAEAVWVTVTNANHDIFIARVLNQPYHLQIINQGCEIKFIVAEGSKYPLMVTEKYLQERSSWRIHPCDNCGLSELYDAPSDLFRISFSNTPISEARVFTSRCPQCGTGVQTIKLRHKLKNSNL